MSLILNDLTTYVNNAFTLYNSSNLNEICQFVKKCAMEKYGSSWHVIVFEPSKCCWSFSWVGDYQFEINKEGFMFIITHDFRKYDHKGLS